MTISVTTRAVRALTCAALLAAAAACDRGPDPVTTVPDAAAIPDPDVSAFGEEVRTQLADQRARVLELIDRDPPPPPGALAEALGSLAKHYHAYEMTGPAVALYALAAERAPREFDWRYLRGAAFHREGDLAAAEREYLAALALDGSYPSLRVRLGSVLLERGDAEGALVHLRSAVARAPDAAAAYEALGRALAAAGLHEDAVRAFERALELAPAATVVHHGLGSSLRELGREEEARAELAKFRPGDIPLDDPVFATLGKLLRGSGARLAAAGRAMSREEWAKAAAIYRDLVEDEPGEIDARLGLGLALLRAGDTDGAIEVYREAARAAPGNIVVHHNLATLLSDRGQLEDAVLQFRRALTIEPGNRDALAGLARALERQGRHGDALEAWDSMLENNPTDAFALSESTRMLFEAGREDEAVRRLERASKAAPADGMTRLTLALARAQAGDLDGARGDFAAIVKAGGDPGLLARAEHGLGRVNVLARDNAAAERHYRAALGHEPDLADARHELGELLAANGRGDEAIEILGPLLESRPGFAPVAMRIADLHARAGRHADARDTLSRAANEGGGNPGLTLALARMLLSSPDEAVRDPERALELARALAETTPAPEVTETIARAYAHLGRFDEAVRSQDALIREVESRAPPGVVAKLRADRERYVRREPPSDP